MPAKGTIKADHIPINKFQLLVAGLPPLTVIKVSGIEEELEVVELPDRTMASGGNTKATEADVETPAHHVVEQAAWESWYAQAQDPVVPTYKRTATLLQQSLSGAIQRTWTLTGVFPKKRGLPDLDMGNAGDQAVITWALSIDDVLPG
jgi:hypothetical protein